MSAEALAALIRELDGSHTLGAAELAERLEKYRDALAFYADPESWKRRQGQWDMTTGPLPRVVGQESDIELDRGHRARLASPPSP